MSVLKSNHTRPCFCQIYGLKYLPIKSLGVYLQNIQIVQVIFLDYIVQAIGRYNYLLEISRTYT